MALITSTLEFILIPFQAYIPLFHMSLLIILIDLAIPNHFDSLGLSAIEFTHDVELLLIGLPYLINAV